MKLKDVLKGLEILSATADMEAEITGVSYDSRTDRKSVGRERVF